MDQETEIKFPSIEPGYALGGLTLASFIFATVGKVSQPDGGSQSLLVTAATALMLIGYITGLVYWVMCVHRLHKTLLNLTGQKYPVSAGQAAGYQFVPLFNVYWIFKWPAEIARFVNHCERNQAMDKYKYGVFLLLASVFSRVLTGISIIVDFAVLAALIKRVKNAVADQRIPVDYEKPKYSGRAAMICLWVFVAVIVIGILAAIAVPNFVKARDDARAKNAASASAPVI